jgi:endonuclease YncB( thermonuclease family)
VPIGILFAFIATASFAQTITGKIISVLDGDTIEVLHNHHAERIRFNGIDCPEKGQAYGTRAKQAAYERVFGKDDEMR